jgi:hypothetical protein
MTKKKLRYESRVFDGRIIHSAEIERIHRKTRSTADVDSKIRATAVVDRLKQGVSGVGFARSVPRGDP